MNPEGEKFNPNQEVETPEFRRFDRSLNVHRVILFKDDLPAGQDVGLDVTHFQPDGQSQSRGRFLESDTPKIFGGWDGFFTEGSRVLELGSGGGSAAESIAKKFPDLQVVAQDISYHDQAPTNNTNLPPNLSFVAADWKDMPYQKESFNRILSLHTFPFHPGIQGELNQDPREFAKEVINQISQISERGTIWRGSISNVNYPPHRPNWNPREFFAELMSEAGWDLYEISDEKSDIFVAQYIGKSES